MTTVEPPKLVQVPALPFVGSLIPQYSGTPKYDLTTMLTFWPEMRKRFGDFYSFGLPGVGEGLRGILHVIQDPHVMAALLRHEGPYPSGAAQFNFTLRRYLESRHSVAQHLFGQGPAWKRVRHFVQTDLLSPASGAQYLPAICEAATSAARGAPHYADQLNEYLNYSSFDMFSYVMLGHNPRVADPDYPHRDPEDVEFCHRVAAFLRLNNRMTLNMWDNILVGKLGWTTLSRRFQTFCHHFDASVVTSRAKLQALLNKPIEEQTEFEKHCYASKAMDRVKNETDPAMRLTQEEAQSMIQAMLGAGVDTTGGNLTWKLLHLALCPRAQERIAQEQLKLSNNNHGDGKSISPHSVTPSNAPYLHACLRESHRLANPASPIPQRRFAQPITVHGVELPPNAWVALDSYSGGVDPEITRIGTESFRDYLWLPNGAVVDDGGPLEFVPERFLPEAVQARRGTRAEHILDHVLFRGPFSGGARQCPGSRVARLETAALIAALCRQWEFTVADDTIQHWTQVPYGLEAVLSCRVPKLQFTPRWVAN
ncbi:hypothetical protein ACA910_022159 [Epithemia clementina (nom. ined.)]